MTDGASSGGMTNEDVLEQFRKQWQQELQIDKHRQPVHQTAQHEEASIASGSVSASNTPLGASTPATDSPSPASPQSRKAELLSRPPPVAAVAATSTSTAAAAPSKGKASTSTIISSTDQTSPSSSRDTTKDATAVELYSAAVQAEREGRLNDALRGYRSAFRKDEHVDRAYHRVQSAIAQKKENNKDKSEATGQDDQIDDLVFSYQRTLQLGPDYEREKQVKGRMFTTNYVERLLKSFKENPYLSEEEKLKRQQEEKTTTNDAKKATPPSSNANLPDDTLAFKPLKPGKHLAIAKLPDEILLQIASHLCALSLNAQYPDVSSLERGFSLVCRKLRILTLQSPTLWRDICEAVYKPPLMLDASKIPTTALQDSGRTHRNAACTALGQAKYFNDWRLMWIEQPRIRTDGVYISQITYLRRGGADASFYDPTHVVTYYRYLVFLPSGDVVSLLSHDIPKEVVPNLLSSTHGTNSKMHKAGYTVGKWRLIHLPSAAAGPTKEGETDTSATIVQCTSLEDPRITNVADVKYSFKLICRLKSTTRGKMNKLEMLQLLTINHFNGTEDQISVKQVNGSMPSFYFSRVLSYD